MIENHAAHAKRVICPKIGFSICEQTLLYLQIHASNEKHVIERIMANDVLGFDAYAYRLIIFDIAVKARPNWLRPMRKERLNGKDACILDVEP